MTLTFGELPHVLHVCRQVLGHQRDERVIMLKLVDQIVTVEDMWTPLRLTDDKHTHRRSLCDNLMKTRGDWWRHLLNDSPDVLRSFSKQAADLPDLLQSRNHPLIIRPKLLDEPIDPLHLLRVTVLYDSRKVSDSTQVHAGNDVALSSDLRAAVVQDLDVGTQGLVHDVHRHVVTVSQVPQ